MRTINEAAVFLQQADPDTAVTKTALRRLVTSGQIPSVRVGAKYLIDLSALDEFLGGQMTKAQCTQPSAIRPLAVVPGVQQNAN